MSEPKQNVLYISYDGMTDPLGQSQVLPYIFGLSKDYNFHLVSFEKEDLFAKYQKTIQQICDEHQITWHPLKYTKRPPILSTIYDIYKLFKLANRLHQKNSFQIVHCRSYISALVGLSFKRKNKAKFIFDMRGFWADERVDGKIWNLSNPIFKIVYNYFKKKEQQYFIESDAIISLTQNGKNEILTWKLNNVTPEKITVIPCCVNINLFDSGKIIESKKNEIRTNLGFKENDFILGYVGSVGTWYMLPEMMDYFKVLLEEKENAQFLFVSGENPDDIYATATQKGIDTKRIKVVRSLHSEVPHYISLFDLSIFFILPVFSKKASSPTKQGELMSMGVPVVCNSGVGDTDFIINTYKSGYLIDRFNEETYRKNIQELELENINKANYTKGAKEFFGLENGVERYLSVYRTS